MFPEQTASLWLYPVVEVEIIRRAQSNGLKTAFHVHNYLTQTRGSPQTPSTNHTMILNTTF
jgi:hypothetical protein